MPPIQEIQIPHIRHVTRPSPPFQLQQGIATDWDNPTPSAPPFHVPDRPHIRKVQQIQLHLQAQGDTGANVSATNRQDILWHYQPLSKPIPIQTYDDSDSQPCEAIGRGYILIVSNANTTMKWKTLYVPQSTGTILSPDAFMMDQSKVTSFHHSSDRTGKGQIQFHTTTGPDDTLCINMERTNTGLWYTSNPLLMPQPTPAVVQNTQAHVIPDDVSHPTPSTTLPQTAAIAPPLIQQYELWHQRLGHPGNTVMHQTQKAVTGIPKFHPKLTTLFHCPFCAKSKLHKAPRNRQAHRRYTIPGTAFHMDLGFIGGPTNLEDVLSQGSTPQGTTRTSRDGYVCYLLIIDAASRYIWVFPLRNKRPPLKLIELFLKKHGRPSNQPRMVTTHPTGLLAASPAFQDTVAQVGFQTAHQIVHDDMPAHQHNVIRTDNGGELAASHDFRQTVLDADYTLEVTAPDSSSQNGLAERPHRTLKDKVRCLLYTAGLGTKFWADALLHAVWLYNRTYHSSTGTTPFEAYTTHKPVCDGILTFGATVTPKKAKRRDNALDPNAYDGIFLGYCATQDNIRYWDIRAQRERHAKHLSHDEIQYGDNPAHRSPASQHLIGTLTNTPHQDRRTDILLDAGTPNLIVPDPIPTELSHVPDDISHHAQDTMHHPSLPTAQVTKVHLQRTHDTQLLIDDIQSFEVTLDPFNLLITERVPNRGHHPLLGMTLEPHPHIPDSTIVTAIRPGSMAAKHIRRYKSRLLGAILRNVDGNRVHTADQIQAIIARHRQEDTPPPFRWTLHYRRSATSRATAYPCYILTSLTSSHIISAL